MMVHKTLSGKQGTVHYWVAGEGDCILFTHGATMDHGLFQPQMDHFASSYKAITWDVPAHGLSRPYVGFSLPAAADELVKILDAENVAQAHLVGQSMGGYIAQMVAVQHPGRARTLAAVDSSPLHASYYSWLDRWLLSVTPALLRLYPYNLLINTIATQVAIQPAARAYARETLRGLSKWEIAAIMEAVYRGVVQYRRAFALSLPVLILYGDADRTGRVQAYCKRWAAQEKKALRVIPGAAHNANMDNPAAFNQLLGEFLRTADG
ncbi:MAG: alpha/beta fold hydrolase [Chloroflexota bacterium]